MHNNQVDCIIKLGGAAITNKHVESSLNDEAVTSVVKTISGLIAEGLRCIIICGAGSFGHIQAIKYDIKAGGYAVSAVRSPVTKLAHLITERLVESKVNALLLSPFPVWTTSTTETKIQTVLSHNSQTIQSLTSQGFVPVLHGDVVIDTSLNYTILSGDVIARVLAEELKPRYVVFLSDLPGVYSHPPTVQGTKIISQIIVEADGFFERPQTSLNTKIDVSGGIDLKLNEAAKIASKGIPVFFAQAGTDGTVHACRGKHESGTHMFLRPK